jgi:hypothetical protein
MSQQIMTKTVTVMINDTANCYYNMNKTAMTVAEIIICVSTVMQLMNNIRHIIVIVGSSLHNYTKLRCYYWLMQLSS